MRALYFTGDSQLEIRDTSTPNPGPGEVLVQVSRAAICGTDMHKYKRTAAEQAVLEDGTPIIAGHEPSGWIAGLGPGVSNLNVGDRIILAGVISCGYCDQCHAGYNVACREGSYGLHWNHHGCDADYVTMPAVNAIRIDPSLNFDAATVLTCAGGTAFTSLKEAGTMPGDRVVVVGLGPVGLCAVILARSMGCRVAGIEPNADRRALAETLGAELLVDPTSEDTEAAVEKWSNNRRANIVVECVGRGSAQQTAINCVGSRGTVAFAGLGTESLNLDLTNLLITRSRGGRLMGVAATPKRYFPELVAMAANFKLPFEKLITHRFPLEQAEKGFDLMGTGQCGKVILDISEEFHG